MYDDFISQNIAGASDLACKVMTELHEGDLPESNILRDSLRRRAYDELHDRGIAEIYFAGQAGHAYRLTKPARRALDARYAEQFGEPHRLRSGSQP